MSKAIWKTEVPDAARRFPLADSMYGGGLKTADVRKTTPDKIRKGAQTRMRILAAAFSIAKREGLQNVTFSRLVDVLDMSKSGIFARFGALDVLHAAVVARYVSEFKRCVLYPALKQAPGIGRLQTLFDHWVAYSSFPDHAGCVWMSSFASMRTEFRATSNLLQELARQWDDTLCALIRQAIEAGDLDLHCDPRAVAFEMQALVLAAHNKQHFLGVQNVSPLALAAFKRLIASNAPAASKALASVEEAERYYRDSMCWWSSVEDRTMQSTAEPRPTAEKKRAARPWHVSTGHNA